MWGLRSLLKYLESSATGTVTGLPMRPIDRVSAKQNLSIPQPRVCRTVPRLATGTLRFSYPQTLSGLRYRLSKCARRFAGLSLAIGGFGSAAVPIVSHRRRTVRHGPIGPRTEKRVAIAGAHI